MSKPALAAWKLPPIVAAIVVSIVGGFYLGGPGLGMAVGALAAATVIVMAVRNPPLQRIVPPKRHDLRRHVLVILGSPLEDGEAIDSLVDTASADGDRPHDPEILLVAPSPHRFLDRWTSDFGPGRERAQKRLVLSVASLAKAGVEARARVGDENLVQTAEDELRSFPATDVILVSGPPGVDAEGSAAAADLEARLDIPFQRLCVGASVPSSVRSSKGPGSKRQQSARL